MAGGKEIEEIRLAQKGTVRSISYAPARSVSDKTTGVITKDGHVILHSIRVPGKTKDSP
jgi:hypothetical protein